MDRPVFRFFGQFVANFPFNGGLNQPFIAVFHRFLDDAGCNGGFIPDHLPVQIRQNPLGVRLNGYAQNVFFFAAVKGKHAVRNNFATGSS